MLLYAVYAGSKLYNLMTPNSDLDVRGVFIEPANIFYSLDTFDYYEDVVSDTALFSLRKFMHLALKNNPNTMDILFAPKFMWLDSTPEWERIYDIRHDILSGRVISAIKGFVFSEYDKWLADKTSRTDHLEKYGYDAKMASHIMRLLFMANSIRATGTYSPTLTDVELRIVYQIKLGQYTKDIVASRIERILPYGFKILTPTLLSEPNYDKINKLVIDLQQKVLNKE